MEWRARTHTHTSTDIEREKERERVGEEEERVKAQELKIQIIGTGWRILEIITHKDQQSNIFLQWDKRDSSPIIEISPISCSAVSVEALVTLVSFHKHFSDSHFKDFLRKVIRVNFP